MIRILYRQFLFRLMDVEWLAASARGDASGLLGQFGALLVFGSVVLTFGAITIGQGVRGERAVWGAELFLITLTMLAAGIFSLLNWDATLADRRDVLVLGPLPVKPRTMMLAKAAAGASGIGLVVAALHCLSGFAWPAMLAAKGTGGLGMLRFIGAFWLSAAAAGAFTFCAVLAVQALAAQLPRRVHLRVSPVLQMGLFAGLLGMILAPDRLPPRWFADLMHELSGAGNATMAGRAVAGLAAAMAAAGGAFLLSYARTLRKTVEEPDAAPGARGGMRLPPFGGPRVTALAQFAIRTATRSRQHRTIVSFYLGGGFAVVSFYLTAASDMQHLSWVEMARKWNAPMMGFSSLVMLGAAWMGTRAVYSLPLDLRANWVFRVMPVAGPAERLAASRRALLATAVLPVVAVSAALWLVAWPWERAVAQAAALWLVGSMAVDLSLRGWRKIPFTCSYLPGKSKAHLVFWFAAIPALMLMHKLVEWELAALASARGSAGLLAALTLAAIGARWWGSRAAEEETRYEEVASDELVGLGIGV